MRLEKEFTIYISETEARKRINTYFEQAMYQPLGDNDSSLKFQRGSRLGTWFPLNPSNLKCIATVKVESRGNNTYVKSSFDLGNIFKDETHFTEKFWNSEMREFEAALLKGEYVLLASKKLTLRAILINLEYIFSGLIWVIVWAAISFALIFPSARYFNSFSMAPEVLAIIIMVIAFFITRLVSRYWRKRRAERE